MLPLTRGRAIRSTADPADCLAHRGVARCLLYHFAGWISLISRSPWAMMPSGPTRAQPEGRRGGGRCVMFASLLYLPIVR